LIFRSNGPLIAAAVFVVAVTAVVAATRSHAPPGLSARMRLAEQALAARLVPPGAPSPVGDLLDASHLAEIAHGPFPDPADRWRGAAVALRLGAPDTAWRFLQPIVPSDPLARVLVQRAFDDGVASARRAFGLPPSPVPALFDPRPAAGPDEVARAAALEVEPGLREELVRAVALHAGLAAEASAAEREAVARWDHAVNVGAGLAAAVLALLGVGIALWVGSRKWAAAPGPGVRPGPADLLPLARVVVWFMAVHLTTSLLVPHLIDRSGYVPDPAALVLALYLANGVAGLALVRLAGAPRPGEGFTAQVGIAGSFAPRGIGRSVAGAAAAFCMAWTAYVGSMFVTVQLGLGGDGGDDPTSLFLVSQADGPGLALPLVSLGLAAPLVEEALFRGYVFGRLRSCMPVALAAALSGFVFAAAHLSLAAFLPLAAIGFTFALAYERTRDLATPVLAHAAWNLAQAALLLSIYG
jgi:membrane protease YdiL (CAAX protease family)